MATLRKYLALPACALIFCALIPFAPAKGAPAVSAVYYPAGMVPNTAYRLYAVVSSPLGIQSCNLMIDGADKGAMTIGGANAVATSTFTQVGEYMALVTCRDGAGDVASGLQTPITIQEHWDIPGSGTPPSGSPDSPPGPETPSNPPPSGTPPSNPPSSPPSTPPSPQPPGSPSGTGGHPSSLEPPPLEGSPTAGALIKLFCPDGSPPDHPCRAVYYFGADGKRHAFPNEKVFFTWYSNFDAVRTVGDAEMAAIVLGNNVTYRPGVKMVKFQTVDKVYAVSKNGTLRWVTSEEVASGLYGMDWNKRIDDISDAFYSNYSFGPSVTSTADYVIATEMSAATVIDQSL